MRKEKFQPESARSLMAVLVFALIAFAITAASHAQSGRRLPDKRTKRVETAPPAKSESETVPSTEQPRKAGIPVLVARYSPTVTDSGYYSSIVSRGCVERLKKSTSLSVTEGREMNRAEASDYAKGSSDIYVAWLEIEVNLRGGNSRSSSQAFDEDFRIRYALYEPGTGKMKTQGVIHQRPYQPRVGGVGLPLPLPSGRSTGEYILHQAGEDAADRFISALNAAKPNDAF
ncbi:MAG: hypothetical protein L0229_18355 [Blastocatellia bacterium]|nr:hypothetical protein [Blastocatellia bacterium]